MSDPSPPRRRFAPEPVETTVKSVRRFAVDPVESTSRSSKVRTDEPSFVKPAAMAVGAAAKKRFLPEPVETSVKSHRQAVKPSPELTPDPSPQNSPARTSDDAAAAAAAAAAPPAKPARKFAPQLIETTKRSKKADDPNPATHHTDKTDITPGTNHIYQPRKSSSHSNQILPLYPRRQGSMRPHCNTRRSTRQNSFTPALETIVSSNVSNETSAEEDDGDDETPSLSGSLNSSEDSLARMQLARTRESCDDRFSGYLLSLAAKAAEKQLREQALAAFPNSDIHNPVEHFYDRELDGDTDDEDFVGVGLLPHERLERRQSTQVGWAAKEMQQHQERLSRQREEDTHVKIADQATAPSFADPFWTNGTNLKLPGMDKLREAELQKMRNAASPPMLGGDLDFRQCPSPKMTKFETDQKHEVKHTRRKDGGGLWGGYCVADEESQYLSPAPRGEPLLQTPQNEREDPFASAFSSEIPDKKSPRTSVASGKGVQMLWGINERLEKEAKRSRLEAFLQEEFDDHFVTQVYNYLSLGYPSLARHYDEELSKITHVTEADLASRDEHRTAKGHIGLEGSITTAEEGVRCPRWSALRIYILEWARQHPAMDDASNSIAWGVRARRGSWAI